MSWLKLKSAVMDAVCRRKLATPGDVGVASDFLLNMAKARPCLQAVLVILHPRVSLTTSFEILDELERVAKQGARCKTTQSVN